MAIATEELVREKTDTMMSAFPTFEEYTGTNVGFQTVQRPVFGSGIQNTSIETETTSNTVKTSDLSADTYEDTTAVAQKQEVALAEQIREETNKRAKKKAKLNWKAKLLVTGYVSFVVLVLGLILGNYKAINAGRVKTPISSIKQISLEKVIYK